ncbi:hypothetical protein PsorP6_001471 [Peronosclerospora sorghi]|uniref:Uncharacterized protein n=1 Tax=Peronosclerospora sorghi TaxID=230839 RepID=A0ACC0WVK0_9STRA|nr:hypothetical protein PsorP6_001471 [Peronosclerospora sorghi]
MTDKWTMTILVSVFLFQTEYVWLDDLNQSTKNRETRAIADFLWTFDLDRSQFSWERSSAMGVESVFII